ncbi:hypothetical protein SPRG_12592 [Saprolegnia parasitica CBS 223.65]|uniref:Uncharacterized protein n=1 Tax=Saprolegnia parasitica (strain CBS 223.65) TaxID=695850 RepID=A0A067C7T7_SAPPC|nr:hypothetical protein SPRG_12592 [Saprolegnia parasitica CBS 223.65]KDO22611.1 hypothetical protein SPRG_12592 [Saprolegnia parasitica CBS 223.65]|eukprot:XP_012206725.1 hypothetical protein SPRG_12592 [Saprolegnia parasitica CBS 223.65]
MAGRKRLPGAVYEGDIVVIKIDDRGHVHSDGFVDERLGCISDVAGGKMDGCLFRITPPLQYEAQKRLAKAPKAFANAAKLRESTTRGQLVHFGQPLQLQHVQSGKFISTISKTVAEMDKVCMRLSLVAHGSSKCHFTLVPCFKTKSIGDTVGYNDAVCIARTKSPASFLHMSLHPINMDRLGRHEINLHTQETMLRLVLYASPHLKSHAAWEAGKVYRLHHIDANAFVTVSANRHMVKAPYLRPLAASTSVSASENMSLKALFVLERQDRLRGGVLHDVTEPVQFRHLLSGRYLTVLEDGTVSVRESPPFEILPCTMNEQSTRDICFIQVSGRGYRLHHPSRIKSNRDGRSSQHLQASEQLHATRQHSDEDGFRLLPVSASELAEAKFIISAVAFLQAYRGLIASAISRGAPMPRSLVADALAALNAMLHFSSIGHRQKQAREAKVLDVLYEMQRCVLRIEPIARDMATLARDGSFRALHRVHRLVNRVLVCLLTDNAHNKNYVATRTAQRYYNDATASSTVYARETLGYIGSETGSKTVYGTLFLNDPTLLATVDASVVAACCKRIEAQGVKAAGILHFLAIICACDGKSVPANQELVVDVLFAASSSVRDRLLIETCECSTHRRSVPPAIKTMTDALPPALASMTPTPRPLGADILRDGFSNIAISWKAYTEWRAGDASLFLTSTELGLTPMVGVEKPLDLAAYQAQLTDVSLHAAHASEAPTATPVRKGLSLGRLLLASLSHSSSINSEASADSFVADRPIAPIAEESISTEATMTPAANGNVVTVTPSQRTSIQLSDNASNAEGVDPASTTMGADVDLQPPPPPRHLSSGDEWVELEAVVWTLDPDSVYHLVFPGQTWAATLATHRKDKNAKAQFDLLHDLAQYYYLSCFSSSSCFAAATSMQSRYASVLKPQLSYTMLVAAIANEKLPNTVRMAFTVIMHHCYVMCFPHDHMIFATKVHTIESIPALSSRATGPVPLPHFELPPTHPANVLYPADDMRSYPYAIKFQLLQAVLHAALSAVATVRVVDATLAQNAFASAILAIVHDLLLCGFYGDYTLQKTLAHVLLCLLDGRNTLDGSSRYVRSALHDAMTKVKTQICDLLSTMTRLWRHVECVHLLSFFKAKYAHPKSRLLAQSRAQRRRRLRRQLAAILDKTPHLDLIVVSHLSLNYICMDLLMYEDPELVQAALTLHIETNSRKARVFEAVLQCLVLESNEAPATRTLALPPTQVLDDVRELLPTLRHLAHLFPDARLCADVRTAAASGVLAVAQLLLEQLQQLQTYACDKHRLLMERSSKRASTFWGLLSDGPVAVRYTPNATGQAILLLLDVHKVALTLLAAQMVADTSVQDAQRQVQAEACKLLVLLSTKNPLGQRLLFENLKVLWRLLDTVDGVGDVVLAVFFENAHLSHRLPAEAIWTMGRLIETHAAKLDDAVSGPKAFATISTIFDFFLTFMAPDDVPLKKHQTAVHNVLHHAQFQHILPDAAASVTPDDDVGSDAIVQSLDYLAWRTRLQSPKDLRGAYLQKVLIVLAGLAAGKNRGVALHYQKRYPLNWCLSVLLDAKMPLGFKLVMLRFFTNVYLHGDVDLHLGSTATAVRNVLLQSASLLVDYGSSAGRRFLSTPRETQFAKLLETYVFDGLLGFITVFCTQHMLARQAEDSDAHVHETLAHALEHVRTNVTMTSQQTLALDACSRALHTGVHRQDKPRRASHVAVTSEHRDDDATGQLSFHAFQLDIFESDEVAAVTAAEANRLVVLWAEIERKIGSNQHSSNMTTRLFYTRVMAFLRAQPASPSAELVLHVLHCLVARCRLDEAVKKRMLLSEIEEANDRCSHTQSFLAACGAPQLVLTLLSGNQSPSTMTQALLLGLELVRGGNIAVQRSFYESFKSGDEQFFATVETILGANIDALKERRRTSKIRIEGLAPMKSKRRRSSIQAGSAILLPEAYNNALHDTDLVDADLLLQFLTALVAGHFLPTQLLLLDQRVALGHANSVNILHVVTTYLRLLVKDDVQVRDMTAADCLTLSHCWKFLIECMQGPCSANQEFLTTSSMVDAFGKVLRAEIAVSTDRVDAPRPDDIKKLKALAVKAMVSLLEGRSNDDVQDRLRSILALPLLKARLIALYTQFHAEKDLHVDDTTWDERFLEEGVNLLTLAKGVFHADRLVPPPDRATSAPKRANFTSPIEFQAAAAAYEDAILYRKTYAFFTEMHCAVEVYWRGRIELVFFPLPSHCRMLQFLSAKKRALLQSMRYDSNDRLKQFMRALPSMNEEMAHVEALSQFCVYNALRPYIPLFKTLSFLLAIFMNLIILVSIEHQEQELSDYVYIPSSKLETPMFLCGLLQIFLSTAVVVFMLVISIPLVFRRRRNAMRKRALEEYKQRKAFSDTIADSSELDVLKAMAEQRVQRWTQTLCAIYSAYLPFAKFIVLLYVCQFAIEHTFPTFPAWTLYTVLFFPVVRSTRTYLETSGSLLGLLFTFAYDVLVEKLTAFYLVYLCTAVLATFYHPVFYFYHLLDLVIMNPSLQNVVLAVTTPARLLGLTALLCLCICYFYAMGLFFFGPANLTDVDRAIPYCATLLDCFVTVLHRGLAGDGGIGSFMSNALQHPPNFFNRDQYWWRFVFDVTFFALKVVLLNMVFGITIDTFGDLRTQAARKDDVRRNVCFICGLGRDVFNAHYLASSGLNNGFEKHIADDHNMWSYLYFMVHVESLDATECTGPEAYVKALLLKHDVAWFPQGMAKCLAPTTTTSVAHDMDDVKNAADVALQKFHLRRDRRNSMRSV